MTPLTPTDPPRDSADASDPKLESLLDDALAPGSPPPYLAQMIVDKTLPQFTEHVIRPSVLARIGRPMFRVAAAVMIGALVVFALVNAPSNTWQNPVAVVPPTDATLVPSLDQLDAQLEALALSAQEVRASMLDTRLELLAMDVEWLSSDPVWNDLSQPQAIEEAVTRYQLDALASEPMQLF